MKHMALVCFAALALACSAPEPAARVYLLAGQSNATGGGDGTYLGPVGGTRYRYYTENGDGSNAQDSGPEWIEVQPRDAGKWGSRFGPELGFAQETPGATVIKFTVNGSGIQRWLPDGDLFDRWMAFNADSPIAGLIWVQGTANAGTNGAEYRGHLDTLGASFPGVPIALVLLHADANRPQADLVRGAQQSFADDTGACLVNIDGWPLKEDSIHWGTATQLEAGARLAECFKRP